MRIVWNKQILINGQWEPELSGVFYKQKKEIIFYFKNNSNLLALSDKAQEPKVIFSYPEHDVLPLPRKWAIINDSKSSFLLLGRDKGIDLEKKVYLNGIPDSVQIAYSKQVKPEKYYEEQPFSLGEYSIFHKGNRGYICRKNDITIWEFVSRAYLYTDIIRWNNRVCFGTAGNSGYFYVLDIENGNSLASIKTGGTKYFIHIDGRCYVLCNSKSAQLLCVDLSTGAVLSQCNIPGKATVNSRLTLIDSRIHAVTFEFKKSQLQGAVWSCIEI